MALVLGVGAWQLALSQSRAREQLRITYDNRATVAVGVLDSIFQFAFSQSGVLADEQFAGRVEPAALAAYAKRGQLVYAAITDAGGHVIAASPGTPPHPGAGVLAAATKNGLGIADLTTVGDTEVVESAVAFQKGARVLVSASPATTFRAFLSASLKPLAPTAGDEAYVVDGHGNVLGAASPDRRPPPPDPKLLRRLGRSMNGVYTQAGAQRYFVSAVEPDTHWHVVVSAPTSVLYRSASGTSRWLPWVILGVLGVALLAIGVLVRRSLAAGTQLAVVNSQLEASQERLRDRAVELQSSNAELQRSNSDLEQFAYVASHDLSAPLRAVAGFSQLLGVRYQGRLDDDADQFITHMQDGVGRMQRIIDDLLAYSRVDRSGMRGEPIDLDAVLDEVLHGLAPEIEERDAVITRDPLGAAFGEPGQLAQVLQNLITNGMKFTAAGVRPSVHVSSSRLGDRVRVSVRDNGIGVDPEHTERIFKMFQRLHSSDEHPGTGIGLAIAQKIIDRHGGQIAVEPAPGGGTIFAFDIPGQAPR